MYFQNCNIINCHSYAGWVETDGAVLKGVSCLIQTFTDSVLSERGDDI